MSATRPSSGWLRLATDSRTKHLLSGTQHTTTNLQTNQTPNYYRPMNDTIKNLTDKERQLFNAVIRGMDAHGCGWYHELTARADMEDNHSTAGVLGSLVKKGLVTSTNEWDPDMLNIDSSGLFWVVLTEGTGEALGLAYDAQYEFYEWTGSGDLPQV